MMMTIKSILPSIIMWLPLQSTFSLLLIRPRPSLAFSPTKFSSPPHQFLQCSKRIDCRLWNDPSSQKAFIDEATPTINGDVKPAINGNDGSKLQANAIPLNGTFSSKSEFDTNLQDFPYLTSRPSNARRPSFPVVLWRFTRPHTLIGSAIAIPSLHLLAAPTYSSFFTLRTFYTLAYATVPSLFMNLYITGLNQITDVEIDKINKPNLPIAKGDLKKSTAIGVVLVSLAISLIMSMVHPVYSTSGLRVALWGSFILGTMYSLPPIRMKRHPLLAAFCIVAVRGTIINAGFYSHALAAAFSATKEAASRVGVLNCLFHDWKCALSSFFFGVFGIVIALMKDVPDAHGDRIFNIRSFTVRVGQTRVFNTMKNLLTLLFGVFGGALMKCSTMAPSSTVAVRRGLVGLGCLVAGWSTNWEAKEVNPEDSTEVYNYYMHLWKLFYLSYLVLPFVK